MPRAANTTPSLRRPGPAYRKVAKVLAASVVAAGLAAALGAAPAEAAAGSRSIADNRSTNALLATNTQGYAIQEGATGLQRVAVDDHVAASWAAQVTASASTVRIKLPSVPVQAGQVWNFASDVRATAGVRAQITVSWYDGSGEFLSWSGGPTRTLTGSSWTRVGAATRAPADASTGQTVVNVLGADASDLVLMTQHDARSRAAAGSSSPVPTPTPTTPTSTPIPTPTPTPTSTPTSTPTAPSSPPVSTTITNLPGQPALTAYGSSSAANAFAHPGALIIAGRDNYDEQPMKNASAAGATVLVYLDVVIDNPYGRYHSMLVNSSACGPATSRWPGSPKANEWGNLQDFRVGSVLQSKLECVLETMVDENPHIGGFFADDLGSRSWYPGFSWDSWGSANQQAYRDGAIALAQTFHDVAVKHGLMVMVNGTWTAGSVASSGGGYPDAGDHGLSLADGGYIEHHSTSELAYWTAYSKGQWGTASGSASSGKPFMYVQASDDATRNAYAKAGVAAFLSTQQDYDTASVWGPFHATGLPTRTRG